MINVDIKHVQSCVHFDIYGVSLCTNVLHKLFLTKFVPVLTVSSLTGTVSTQS